MLGTCAETFVPVEEGIPTLPGSRNSECRGRVVSEPSVMRHTDKAACSLRLTSVSPIVASGYSEEPGAEILYHGKDRLWIAAVLGWLRRPS
jgi:hypothetical protein